MEEGLLFLKFFNTIRQLFVFGRFRPLHAVNGTIEAFGCEAGTGLSFGFEWHFSGKELDERLQHLQSQGNDRVGRESLVE
jgi:hypothetical protein